MPENILDKIFFKAPIRRALFNCFLIIFVLTALLTLAGLIKLLPIDSQYLEKLFYALILELVGGVIGMFTATFGKGVSTETERNIQVQLIFPDLVDITKRTPIIADFVLLDSDPLIPPIKEGKCRVSRFGHSLIIDLKEMPTDKHLNVMVELDGKKYQGSQNLKMYPLEMEAL